MEHDKHEGGEQDENDEGPEQLRQAPPRIYVASLADYNEGRLHGAWLDVRGELRELEEGVRAMLAASKVPGAEEWAIHDYEGFAPLRLGEYESLERIARIGRGIARHGEAFKHWTAIEGITRLDLVTGFEDAYRGHWQSVEAFVMDFWDDCGSCKRMCVSTPQLSPAISNSRGTSAVALATAASTSSTVPDDRHGSGWMAGR